jgi:hypothetical protein
MPIGIYPRPPRLARFWAQVDKNGPVPPHRPELGPCWVWTGSISTATGYGSFHLSGRNHGAHRVAYLFTYGDIPAGLWVLHACDKRPCVRPDHLWLGTNSDNMKDAVQKGRAGVGDRSGPRLHPERMSRGDNHYARTNPELLARGDRHWSHLHPELTLRGENAPNAKLTTADVLEIRRRRAAGESCAALGREFRVSTVLVSKIARGKVWTHLL